MLPASGTTRCFAVSADPILYHQIVFSLRLRLRQVIIEGMIYQFSLLTANLETYAPTVHWPSPCFQAGNYHDTHTTEQSNTFER